MTHISTRWSTANPNDANPNENYARNMSCVVDGCRETATTPVLLAPLGGRELAEAGPWTVVACDFHAQALEAGEAWTEADDGKIRLGTHGVAPRLLDYRLAERGLSFPELTLYFGHDGVVSGETTIQISRELHRYLFMNDEAELAKEVKRNKRDAS